MAEEGGGSSSSSNRNIIRGSLARELHDRNKQVEEMANIHTKINEERRHCERIQRDVAPHLDEIRGVSTFTVGAEGSLEEFFACNTLNRRPMWEGQVIVRGKTRFNREGRVTRVKNIVKDYYGKTHKHLVKIVADADADL